MIKVGLVCTILSVLLSVTPVRAELLIPQLSPKASVSQRIGVTDFSVTYHRPAVNGRKIWGELVPYGEVWRTGANACTEFKASSEFEANGKKIPAGEYCLSTIPGDRNWTVIFNSDSKQWGAYSYDERKDVARIIVTPSTADFKERLQFTFEDVTEDTGILRLRWENLALDITLGVPTERLAIESISSLSSERWMDYAQAARYLLEGPKDVKKALKYANRSVELQETWFNNWLKARALQEQGNSKAALEAANKAISLGDDSPFYKMYQERVKKTVAELKQ